MAPRPVVLLILDGYGLGPDVDDNAIARCGSSKIAGWMARYPWARIATSGNAVGLPEGQIGNSEVGHMTLGTGRVIFQSLPLISRAISDGSFFDNPALAGACDAAKQSGGALHLLGLLSDGGVHSHVEHLHGLLELARRRGVERVFVHAFLDGRDVPPSSGRRFVADLQARLARTKEGRIATVMGRYWAMDRDQRWERVARAHAALVGAEGEACTDAVGAVDAAYARGETDEFVQPFIVQEDGQPVGPVRDGDAVIFFNFRADRAREITRALTEPDFPAFPRAHAPKLSFYACMTEYQKDFPHPVAFRSGRPERIFGEILAERGLKQFRTAETEKYAHVTFFLNGGREEPFPGEDRQLVPSPKVATYDLQPRMSAFDVTREMLARIQSGRYDVIVCNYANPDMVGHTGVFSAATEAVRVIDDCVDQVIHATLEAGGMLVLTADHGNIEDMLEDDGHTPMTAHTTNPVPCLFVAAGLEGQTLPQEEEFLLADIAPTILTVLDLPVPAEMTGRNLLASLTASCA